MRFTPPSATARRANRPSLAFTLIELLVVIAIIGLLMAVGIPAFKGFGKSNAIAAADRQLLDDLAFARQRAIAERTVVYVIFASPNLTNISISSYTAQERVQVTNILNRQYSAYTMFVRRTVGDQPGRAVERYLMSWESLPEGIFIAPQKFNRPNQSFKIDNFDPTILIYGFNTNSFPFPAVTNNNFPQPLPFVAFNYLGQLTDDGINPSFRDEYIPLARGSIFYDTSFNADPLENPSGSTTNLYNIVHIDALTGRARIEQQEIQ